MLNTIISSLTDDFPDCNLAKVDLIIILDGSTSVGQANYAKMITFVQDFVSKADIDSGNVRVGALIYSTDVQIQFNLNDFSTTHEIVDAVGKIPYVYGSTNTADAIMTMRNMFNANDGDRDGVANIGTTK